jgi:hypothetical protein
VYVAPEYRQLQQVTHVSPRDVNREVVSLSVGGGAFSCRFPNILFILLALKVLLRRSASNCGLTTGQPWDHGYRGDAGMLSSHYVLHCTLLVYQRLLVLGAK